MAGTRVDGCRAEGTNIEVLGHVGSYSGGGGSGSWGTVRSASALGFLGRAQLLLDLCSRLGPAAHAWAYGGVTMARGRRVVGSARVSCDLA
jgi:hypothetical protein